MRTGTARAATCRVESRRPWPSYERTVARPGPGTVTRVCWVAGRGRAQQRGAVPVAAEHEAGDERLHHQRVQAGLAAGGGRPDPAGARGEGAVQRHRQQRARSGGVAGGPDVAGPHHPDAVARRGEGGPPRGAAAQVDDRHQQGSPARGQRERGGAPGAQRGVAGAAVQRLTGPQRLGLDGPGVPGQRGVLRLEHGRREPVADRRGPGDRADGRVRVEREHGEQAVDRGLGAGVVVHGAVGGHPVEGDAGGRVVGRAPSTRWHRRTTRPPRRRAGCRRRHRSPAATGRASRRRRRSGWRRCGSAAARCRGHPT